MRSRIRFTARVDSRPSGRREAIEAAEQNRAVVVLPASSGRSGIGGDEHGAGGVALAAHPGQPGPFGGPQTGRGGWGELGEVEVDQLLATQPGGEQQVNDGPVAKWPAMTVTTSNGATASTRDSVPMADRGHPAPLSGPRLAVHNVRSSSDRERAYVTADLWLWPLPPVDELSLSAAWATFGLTPAVLTIDASPITEAATRVQHF